MPDRFESIETLADLDRLFEESVTRVVVLYNHDPWCPISARAFREMARVTHDVAIVDVSREREITAAIAERTGVRHESPQVILLRHGSTTWHASHFAITAEAVHQAVVEADSAATPAD